MKVSKRSTAIFLTFIILLPVLAACSDSQHGGGILADSVSTVAEDGETADMTYQPELPGADFDQQPFNFLLYGNGQADAWSVVDIDVEESDGEVINDAIVQRNIELEERYNFEITSYYDMSAAATLDRTIRSMDNDFQAVWLPLKDAGASAQAGSLYEFSTLPHVNLNKGYWDSSIVDDLSIAGNVYYMTGDISTIDNQATWMMMFNKNMVSTYGIENPYELVYSGEWIIDKFASMVKDITDDIDGNGVYDKNDQYGLSTTADTVYGLFYSCGAKVIAKDADDLPIFGIDQNKVSVILEKTIDILSKENSLLSNRITGSANAIVDIRNAFEEDRALFYAEVMFHVAMLRQMETDFGIIPLPKFDEIQENYITFVNPVVPVVSIPITNDNIEMAGFILEAMAAASYKYLTPAYYEIALKGKYARDEESSAMLDLLLVNRAYDLGLIYGWGAFPTDYNTLAINGTQGVASLVARTERSITRSIERFIEEFEEL